MKGRVPRFAVGLAAGLLLLALAGCSQYQQYRCVRDTVNRHEPYPSLADRWDAEAMAKEMCAQRAATQGK
jgi:hypothetical protein